VLLCRDEQLLRRGLSALELGAGCNHEEVIRVVVLVASEGHRSAKTLAQGVAAAVGVEKSIVRSGTATRIGDEEGDVLANRVGVLSAHGVETTRRERDCQWG